MTERDLQRARELAERLLAQRNGTAREYLGDHDLDVPLPPPAPPPARGDYDDSPPAGAAPSRPSAAAAAPKPPEFPEPIPASALRRLPGSPWLWHGYLAPGCTTLLSALWKAGKTTLIAHLLKAFEAGGEFCGLPLAPAKVLYVTEESETRWAVRRDQLGLRDHLSFLVRPFRGRPDWATWQGFMFHLRALCVANPVDLVVLDPLVNLWPVRDENDNAQVISALLPLQHITDRAALLLVHHHRKGDGQEGTASRGAGALMGFVDTIVELRRHSPSDRADRRRVLTSYGRDDETADELVVELTEQGYAAHGSRADVGRRDALTVLSLILPDRPPGWTADKILEEWPGEGKVRRNALFDALRRGVEGGLLLFQGEGVRGNPVTYWRLPPRESVSVPSLYREGTETESGDPPAGA